MSELPASLRERLEDACPWAYAPRDRWFEGAQALYALLLSEAPEFDEAAARVTASKCTEWHGCATGDCPHEKYVECFDAIHVAGQLDLFHQMAAQLAAARAEIDRLTSDRENFVQINDAGEIRHVFQDKHIADLEIKLNKAVVLGVDTMAELGEERQKSARLKDALALARPWVHRNEVSDTIDFMIKEEAK